MKAPDLERAAIGFGSLVRRMKAGLASLVCLLGLTLCLATRADPAHHGSERLLQDGLAALERGAVDEAIDQFELLADRGFVHADASFDRAIAYIRRARSPSARPGDLGRAAAALSETLMLRPDDGEAEAALERVRAEIARRRAREGATAIMVRPKLGRALTELLPEDAWAIGGAIGSAILTLSLALLRLTTTRAARLGAAIAAFVATALLLSFGALAAVARFYRHNIESAVVIAPEARLLDESGAPLAQHNGIPEHVAIPEGAAVDVTERRGELVRIDWGTSSGWVTLGQLRLLAKTPAP